MKSARTARRGWFRFGCLTVVGIVGLALVWSAVVVGSAFLSSRSETVERRELQRDVGPPPAQPNSSRTAGSNAGRVILDFTVGEFFVEPGKPGEPILVEAKYDSNSYTLDESFQASEEDGWVYRLTFSETGVLRDGGLRVLFGGDYPKLRVRLPPDSPIALEAYFGKGGAKVELGGLWLTEVDLEIEKGGLDVSIDRPLVEPVRRFTLRGKQGSLSARSLGNASPRELDFDHRMGGSLVDLRGLWLNDAEVRIRSKMGGSQIVLPKNVRIEGIGGRGALLAPREAEIPPPTLRMKVSSFLGGMSIVD